MTPSLLESQRTFAAAIFEDATQFTPQVRDGVFTAARHLQIYRNNTFANLTDALGACYPVVNKLVGDDFFGFLATHYIRRHPPRSGNLHDFGAALPAFVAGFEPAQSLPYLPDVARLEWAWQESYHAADAAPLLPDALAAVAPERYPHMVFHMLPSARLLDSPFPCLRIWQVNQPGAGNDAAVDLNAGAEQLLVIRPDIDVEIVALGDGEYALLRAFADGKPLGSATDAACATEPAFDLGATLRRHVAAGTFTEFDIAPTNDTVTGDH